MRSRYMRSRYVRSLYVPTHGTRTRFWMVRQQHARALLHAGGATLPVPLWSFPKERKVVSKRQKNPTVSTKKGSVDEKARWQERFQRGGRCGRAKVRRDSGLAARGGKHRRLLSGLLPRGHMMRVRVPAGRWAALGGGVSPSSEHRGGQEAAWPLPGEQGHPRPGRGCRRGAARLPVPPRGRGSRRLPRPLLRHGGSLQLDPEKPSDIGQTRCTGTSGAQAGGGRRQCRARE